MIQARPGWARPNHESSDQPAYKSVLSNVVSLKRPSDVTINGPNIYGCMVRVRGRIIWARSSNEQTYERTPLIMLGDRVLELNFLVVP